VSLPQGLRALRFRNFRLFFIGQGVSQIGSWLQMIATSWLVYHLSGSAFLLGLRHSPCRSRFSSSPRWPGFSSTGWTGAAYWWRPTGLPPRRRLRCSSS